MQKAAGITKIVNGLRNGQIKAFEKLFKLYHPRLLSYANYFLDDPYESEDLIQEVFIQVWNRRETFLNEKQFTSYLFTMVRNKCLNVLKRKIIEDKYVLNQSRLQSEELYHISFGAEDNFISMEMKLSQLIEKTICEMPERCQQAFRLKWLEGKKIREISEIMNISTTMVDKHLAKGMEIARKRIDSSQLLLFICLKENSFDKLYSLN